MAITVAEPSQGARPFKMGTFDAQIMTVSANSGATSGTLTASSLARFNHVILPAGFTQTTAPSFSGNAATLAFTVPAETAAAKTYQSSMTVTAVANQGAAGNSTTVAFTGGATAGNEVVTVTGTAISIQVESGVSTATQVKAKYDASAAAVALATMALVGGHASDTVSTAGASALTGGVTGGANGFALCLGRP